MKPPRTIAVDFDGVIHAYTSGWTGPVPTDEPVPGAREGIAKIRARGLRVVVFTCRALTVEGRAGIAAWLVEHGIEVDDVTAIKPHASVYLDDRAVRFEGLWSLAVEAALDVPAPWNAAEQTHAGGRSPTCGECGGEVALDPRPDGRYRECGHPIPEAVGSPAPGSISQALALHRRAWGQFHYDRGVDQLAEEAAELVRALMHERRGRICDADAREKILGEIADVMLCVELIVRHHGITNGELGEALVACADKLARKLREGTADSRIGPVYA